MNLGENADFTDAPGNQLGVLAAEIEDQQLIGMNIEHGVWP